MGPADALGESPQGGQTEEHEETRQDDAHVERGAEEIALKERGGEGGDHRDGARMPQNDEGGDDLAPRRHSDDLLGLPRREPGVGEGRERLKPSRHLIHAGQLQGDRPGAHTDQRSHDYDEK